MATANADLEVGPRWADGFRRTAAATWVQWRSPEAAVWIQEGAAGWGAGWWNRAGERESAEGHQWGLSDRESALARAWTFWRSLAADGADGASGKSDESLSPERRLLGLGADASAAEVDETYQRLARAWQAEGVDRARLRELRSAYQAVREELRRAESMERKVRAASEREQRQEAELERRRAERRRRRAAQDQQRREEAEQRRREAEQLRRRREQERQRETRAAEERRRAEDRRRRAEQEAGAHRARETERQRRAGAGRQRDPLAEHRRILAVPATATRAEIAAAHRRLAKAHHPDAGGSTEQMVAINLARDALLAALAPDQP